MLLVNGQLMIVNHDQNHQRFDFYQNEVIIASVSYAINNNEMSVNHFFQRNKIDHPELLEELLIAVDTYVNDVYELHFPKSLAMSHRCMVLAGFLSEATYVFRRRSVQK